MSGEIPGTLDVRGFFAAPAHAVRLPKPSAAAAGTASAGGDLRREPRGTLGLTSYEQADTPTYGWGKLSRASWGGPQVGL